MRDSPAALSPGGWPAEFSKPAAKAVIGEGASAVAARAERLAILAHLERDTTRLLPADAALARRMASRNAAGTGAAASAAFASALVSAAGVAAAGAAAPIGAAGNGFREGAPTTAPSGAAGNGFREGSPTTAPSGAAGNGFRDFREGARLTGSAIYEATHGLTKPAAGWTNPPAGLGAGLSGQDGERLPEILEGLAHRLGLALGPPPLESAGQRRN